MTCRETGRIICLRKSSELMFYFLSLNTGPLYIT